MIITNRPWEHITCPACGKWLYMHFNHLSCITTCELYLLLFSCYVMYNSFWPHGLQRARLLCPSLSPGVCSHSCPSSRWCYLTILSSVIPFSSCPQSFPASGSFSMSQHFPSGGQSIGASASASVLPMNIQGWVMYSAPVLQMRRWRLKSCAHHHPS